MGEEEQADWKRRLRGTGGMSYPRLPELRKVILFYEGHVDVLGDYSDDRRRAVTQLDMSGNHCLIRVYHKEIESYYNEQAANQIMACIDADYQLYSYAI
jgi:hypothetical protein